MDYSLLIGVHDAEQLQSTDEAPLPCQSSGESAAATANNNHKPNASSTPQQQQQQSNNADEKPDSDQDNLSPTEDTEDTDDDQLNLSAPTPPESPTSKLTFGIFGMPSVGGSRKEVYFMALIDILTHYGLKKRSANVAKTVKYGDQEISTVKPDQYSKRFLDFINKIID